jgi:hypothetical protein
MTYSYAFSSLLLFASPPFLKAMDLNCISESMDIFNDRAYAKAYMKYDTYVLDKCITTEINDFCSWSDLSNETHTHWTVTLNLEKIDHDKVPKAVKRECKKAGGIVVEASYDVGLEGTNFAGYYDMEMDPSTFYIFDFFVVDDIVCIGSTSCKNSTDVGEFIKYSWALYFGVDAYTFNLHGLKWDDITSLH